MYVIVVYDIKSGPRGPKIMKYLRQRLLWVQNSVFEGEVTDSGWEEILFTLKKMMNKEKDSIIYYTFESRKYHTRKVLGLEKNSTDSII